MSTHKAGILSTGTEIMQGLYADTNAQYLAGQLDALGLEARRIAAVSDHGGEVGDAIAHLCERCDVVIMTGGLGPTEDDLTRQAVCQVFGVDLEENAEAWRRIEERFQRRTEGGEIPKSNRAQAQIPRGARVLQNDWGTAPGWVIDNTDGAVSGAPRVWFAALPGPPRENRPMFEARLAEEVGERFGGGAGTVVRVLHTVGLSESLLNDMLGHYFKSLADDEGRGFAFLAGQARVDIRLHARAATHADAEALIEEMRWEILARIPDDRVYGEDNETLESVVGEVLRKKNLTLAVAESCTGGLICKRLTDIPGSSSFLREGLVTYSNESKIARLGVRDETLRQYGAVSEETVREMALGVLRSSCADIAVATTGVAGPDGGTEEKPVGLVWYGVAWRKGVRDCEDEDHVETCKTAFTSGRDLVRLFASHRALDLVRRVALGMNVTI